LLDHTREVLFLEDGEIATIERDGVQISQFDGTPVERVPRRITWDPVTAQKGGFKHFLAKEIHEQGQALIDTMRGRLLPDEGDVVLDEIGFDGDWCRRLNHIDLVACGTAWHACLVAKFYIERLARVSCSVDYGSEFRYREPVLGEHDLILVVSQSGETADTLAAVAEAHERSCPSLAVCNVVDSSIARHADAVIYTHAGPEISVASTKAFTTQLILLLLFAIYLGRRRGTLDKGATCDLVNHLMALMTPMARVLALEPTIDAAARRYAQAEDFLFLGRGLSYPIALEGALKLKELSYIHAEGYPAGEMKHGPIALINEEMPVLVLLPDDSAFPKTLANLREVESRGGQIISVTDRPDEEVRAVSKEIIEVPTVHPLLMPVLLTIPLQLLAYHVAVHRGTDVDQPRNLAKSVTVE
jgi:glucosamine--fructose-6-phosphate aminotransferase (isomerizing)